MVWSSIVVLVWFVGLVRQFGLVCCNGMICWFGLVWFGLVWFGIEEAETRMKHP